MPTISDMKELKATETPLFLFTFQLPSGAVEKWCTHAVNLDGEVYAARVLGHNLFEMKSDSEEGIDSLARLSVTLANTDSYCSQIERSVGWKGARVTVRFLFFDLKNGVAASESTVVFRGLANSPDEITETTLRLSVSNRLNLQRLLLPEVRIQRRCPWKFPGNAQQRAEATTGGAQGKYSPFFRCGYSPDVPGGRGSLDGAAPYSFCDYTRPLCEQRGMFKQDASGNPTRRFGGIEFVPPSIQVRTYGEKSFHVSPVVENEGRYNDFVPMVYGTGWYAPPIVFARNDGNLTRLEILLGLGEIHAVLKVRGQRHRDTSGPGRGQHDGHRLAQRGELREPGGRVQSRFHGCGWNPAGGPLREHGVPVAGGSEPDQRWKELATGASSDRRPAAAALRLRRRVPRRGFRQQPRLGHPGHPEDAADGRWRRSTWPASRMPRLTAPSRSKRGTCTATRRSSRASSATWCCGADGAWPM